MKEYTPPQSDRVSGAFDDVPFLMTVPEKNRVDL
jgi:hypothetical protein